MIGLIENGVLAKNERLPSLREFASSFRVSINTARSAYDVLERERYVRTVPQSGYYVTDRVAVSELSPVDALSLDPREVGLGAIASAMAASGAERPAGIDVGLSYLARDLIPANTLRLFTDDAHRFHRNMPFPLLAPHGYVPLRQQIALHSLSIGLPVKPESVIVTSGCQESIYVALQAVAPTDAFVAVEDPAPFSVLRILEALRLRPIEIPCSGDGGMSLEALAFALDRYPVAAVVTNGSFMNPTGALMPDEKKRELVRISSSRNVPIIEDDSVGDLFFAGRRSRPGTCLSFDRDENVIYCSSFSRTVAPNLRLGWIIPGKWRRSVERLTRIMNLGMSAIPQISMALLLEDGFFPRHLRKVRGALRARVPAARAAILAAFPAGTLASDPSGGVSLWVTLPGGRKSEDLYARAVPDGILVAPGNLFGVARRHESSFRVNASVLIPDAEGIARSLGSLAAQIPRHGEAGIPVR
ncbi:MAG: hypothetical protein CVV47_03450 [Spirochaetae bacterium HGW-Spirochaetae-3]|jgi:DNA-binding transcriptional MocR family regulator|nr:MAG: hypothetical protein CVV47_03450 [Spirochaetae bacterium HGW-Spirochaetae-3]